MTRRMYVIEFPEINLKVETTNLDVIVKAELKIEPNKIFTSQDKLGINFKDNQAIINEMKKHVIRDVLKQYNKELLKVNGMCKYLPYCNDKQGNCAFEPNCYFKQLARKTQELEVICKAFDIEYAYNDDGKIFGRSNKLRSLEQECEELKKDLQDYESWFDEYKILFTYDGRTPVTNDELYTCLEELVKKGNDETNHYHKALEEIEKVINNILNSCLGRNTVGCRPAHNVCGDLIKILDIINKVKEEENE